jgi:hypothetical protein
MIKTRTTAMKTTMITKLVLHHFHLLRPPKGREVGHAEQDEVVTYEVPTPVQARPVQGVEVVPEVVAVAVVHC